MMRTCLCWVEEQLEEGGDGAFVDIFHISVEYWNSKDKIS
jgi:hypothetical protein